MYNYSRVNSVDAIYDSTNKTLDHWVKYARNLFRIFLLN